MAIHVALHHRTVYTFDRPTVIHPHTLRLRPAVHARTPILSYGLNVEPEDHFINWQQDPFGNYLARLVFNERSRQLAFDISLVADMTVIDPFDFFVEERAETFPFEYEAREKLDLTPYLELSEQSSLLDAWIAEVDRTPLRTVDFLVGLNQRLAADIGYSIRMEPGVQSCETTLSRGIGSCRDTGWLLVQILRRLGLAARFVSGYLIQLAPDVKALDGPSGPSSDFTDLHAWTEVYIPGAGWIGLDPTSGLLAGEGHIPLACTPSPASAAPVTGSTGPCEVEFSFVNDVTRLHEDPRVTKPYTETQWQGIRALGKQVDADLDAGDVRLTMGGEPTFVSIDDMESPQWNIAADGAHKRELAETLTRRLREAFAPGGVLYYGQGKWYPGEPLPRWQKACFWRPDGVPVWHRPQLLAEPEVDLGHTRDDALRFARLLTTTLSLPRSSAMPVFEDPVQHLWAEGRLPKNLTMETIEAADLDAADERRGLLRVLAGNLNAPVGHVIPLEYSQLRQGWLTSAWPLRLGKLILVPGDSPVGYRLPMDSLPFPTDAEKALTEYSVDPLAPRAELTDNEALTAATAVVAAAPGARGRLRLAGDVAADGRIVRTALSIEVRGGALHVFLPPLDTLEAWLELIGALEYVASELELPVVLEGYDPPRDHRLQKFAVTPDPGVIEVNIHPATSFDDLVDHTERLYEIARECRLGAEKFMLDGRHTGTGGGNHVTLGGATPADSPLLRRPSLLRSLITHWQNHPALSYLFSGLFIGPTSQAPRVDEARDDRLYELEIAFSQLPEGDEERPWLIDRALRNLLTDLTGNTHRSEFCIDKLYSPDSSTGRLGILELRAFEMPPHARMSLLQTLLLRALVARFWREPLQRDLVHWGTQLHDQFMLPHFLRNDLQDVLTDLADHGYRFDMDWFAPFFEFRFPRIGTMNCGDVEVELRVGIEPWHVLGEEATGSGTARYVDSSVERLQVRATGLVGDRYQIACNGRRVPLRATGVRGEGVAGVRYKAWAPPSALHPGIGIDTPLVFDVVDTWNQRSIGGCTYHVTHAGGRNNESFPVNAYEAESRRTTRFWNIGHHVEDTEPEAGRAGTRGRFVVGGSGVGGLDADAGSSNPDYPLTLDLRRK